MTKSPVTRVLLALLLLSMPLVGFCRQDKKASQQTKAESKVATITTPALVSGKETPLPVLTLVTTVGTPFKRASKRNRPWIVCTLHVNTGGQVVDVTVDSFSSAKKRFDMSNELMPSLKRWAFEPMLKNEKATAFTWTLRFVFGATKRKEGVNIYFHPHGAGDPQHPESFTEILKIVPPVPTLRVEPTFPRKAKEAGIQGMVRLEAIFDDTGKQSSLKVTELKPGPGWGFAEEALRTVKRWKYKPATVNAKPTAMYWGFTLHFQFR